MFKKLFFHNCHLQNEQLCSLDTSCAPLKRPVPPGNVQCSLATSSLPSYVQCSVATLIQCSLATPSAPQLRPVLPFYVQCPQVRPVLPSNVHCSLATPRAPQLRPASAPKPRQLLPSYAQCSIATPVLPSYAKQSLATPCGPQLRPVLTSLAKCSLASSSAPQLRPVAMEAQAYRPGRTKWSPEVFNNKSVSLIPKYCSNKNNTIIEEENDLIGLLALCRHPSLECRGKAFYSSRPGCLRMES